MIASVVLWTAIGFLSGSLMFSQWLARAFLRADLRTVGDGNPGTTNVFKAGGKWIGVLAFVLDVLKGAIPVALARYAIGIDGIGLVAVSLAPVLGHAFSPFMRFNGGKAVAVTFGVWMALSFWEVPFLGGVALALWYTCISNSGWAMAMTLASLFVYLLLFGANPLLLVIFALNAVIIMFKYRADLSRSPALRPWISRRLWSSTSPAR